MRGHAGHHLDHQIVANGREARCAKRIDVTANLEVLFHKGLHACACTAKTPVAQTDNDVIACFEITIKGIDDHRFLKRTLMAFLIEAHAELLYGGRALARERGAGVVFSRNKIRARGVGVLKQGPIGIKTEGRFKPRAIGHAGGAQRVVDDDFLPGTGDYGFDIARHFTQERHVLGQRIQIGRSDVIAEHIVQLVLGHLFHLIQLLYRIMKDGYVFPAPGLRTRNRT